MRAQTIGEHTHTIKEGPRRNERKKLESTFLAMNGDKQYNIKKT